MSEYLGRATVWNLGTGAAVYGRQARWNQLRRRRRGLISAIVALLVLLVTWDLTCRLDELNYNSAALNEQREQPSTEITNATDPNDTILCDCSGTCGVYHR
jgi:hypothetical protein